MHFDSDSPPWIPLGSANLIDWKFLDHPKSAKNAKIYVHNLGQEGLLLRTWPKEDTRFVEFFYLASGRTGTIVLNYHKLGDDAFRVEVTADLKEGASNSFVYEYKQHPRTGLFEIIKQHTVTLRGAPLTSAPRSISPSEAQLLHGNFEFLLDSKVGEWIADLIDLHKTAPEQIALAHNQAHLLVPEVKETPPSRSVKPVLETPSSSMDSPAAEPIDESRAPTHMPNLGKHSQHAELSLTQPPEDIAHQSQETNPEPPKTNPPPESKKNAITPPARIYMSTDKGDYLEISQPETIIGRSQKCDVVLDSQRVSRRHASIVKEEDGFYLQDLGASNGVWMGTRRVEKERIENGSGFMIGDVLVTFTHPSE